MAKFVLTRIEASDWATQPDLNVGGVTVAEYSAIQRHREKLLRIVHREIAKYLNTPGMYGEGEGFPDRLRMTGATTSVPSRTSPIAIRRGSKLASSVTAWSI